MVPHVYANNKMYFFSVNYEFLTVMLYLCGPINISYCFLSELYIITSLVKQKKNNYHSKPPCTLNYCYCQLKYIHYPLSKKGAEKNGNIDQTRQFWPREQWVFWEHLWQEESIARALISLLDIGYLAQYKRIADIDIIY